MTVRLRLPATSANLGPGFDTAGLAMRLYLDLEAATAEQFSIEVTGRDAALVGSLESNLLVETYRDLAPAGPALHLRVHNEIPLGMGCGSSAAALCAGVLLANAFGRLGLSADEVLGEACRREGHPDNVAACLLGGMTVSSMRAGRVHAATFAAQDPPLWRLLLALPRTALSTTKARALLPESYSRAAAVENIQATALLVAAFAQGRADLLLEAARDALHQPYRAQACPLLPALEPLAGREGILSVTLSGAGPSVLLVAAADADLEHLRALIAHAAGDLLAETLETAIAPGGMPATLGTGGQVTKEYEKIPFTS